MFEIREWQLLYVYPKCMSRMTTNGVCLGYVDAVTNVSSPGDSHVYYLPLGVNLPGASRPTCSTCMQETMGIFQEYAGNASHPLSNTYLPAAQQMNIGMLNIFVLTRK